jgi:alpha-L-rhamnosidase
LTVGHGEHEWEIPDSVAKAPRPSWASATVRELIDNAALWQEVVDQAVDVGVVSGEEQAASLLGPYLNAPASSVASAFVPDERFPGGSTIRARIAAILEEAS